MKHLFLFLAFLLTAVILYPLDVSAKTDAEIIISVEDAVLSDRAFDVDLVFSFNEAVKGGSAELFFDGELLEVKNVSLTEKTSDESFSYNIKESSIKFNFTCYMNENKSRIVRIRFSSLKEYYREKCRFYISDGCICKDSYTIIFPQKMPSVETVLMKDVPEDKTEQSNEKASEISKKNDKSSEESEHTANIIYIQEKSEGSPVSQIVFLSVLGTGIAAAAAVMIITRIVNRKKR